MNKLSHLSNAEWTKFSFPPVFACRDLSSETRRIESAAPNGDPMVFERLVLCLEPPYILLYVLHTPRGEADPGRYQSPAIEAEQLRDFISTFKDFLAADSRFDLWAHSPAQNATVVWDRHNLLYAYGPIADFTCELRALGFVKGELKVPCPHRHHYRNECDEAAKALLACMDWSYSPLQPEDKQ